jgi:hypothetical protein
LTTAIIIVQGRLAAQKKVEKCLAVTESLPRRLTLLHLASRRTDFTLSPVWSIADKVICSLDRPLDLEITMSAPVVNGEAEKNIEIWKVKKLIKRLESARGNGTSMISLIIRMYKFICSF